VPLRAVVALIALASCLACAAPVVNGPAAGQAPAGAGPAGEARFLMLLNRWRLDARLAPVVAEARLERAARAHAADLVSRRSCSHTGRRGSAFTDRAAAEGYPAASGEVLACGIPDAAEAFRLLARSRSHRRIMAEPAQRDVGIAEVRGTWVVVFGY
jgi:uncharacterized protein YkwD